MREKRFSVRALVLTVVLTVLLTAALLAGILCLLLGKEGMSMAQAMVLINTQFVGEHDIGEAVDGAMDSLITGLGDRWSYYMDAEGYARQKENKSNAYVGLGCTVSYPETEGLLIEAVTEAGPADKAGLKAGDLILEIDGVRMEGEARSRATEYTRGPDGSEAELLVRRADGIEQRFKVVRARVEEHPVSYERLDDGTGVVTIRNFNSRCAEEAVAAVEELEAQGVERLVFDVRNNGGGAPGDGVGDHCGDADLWKRVFPADLSAPLRRRDQHLNGQILYRKGHFAHRDGPYAGPGAGAYGGAGTEAEESYIGPGGGPAAPSGHSNDCRMRCDPQ